MENLNQQADYPKYVDEYYDKSTEREVLNEWVLENSSKIIVSDFSSGKYSILDVGTPDGETNLKILSLIWRNLEPGTAVTYRVVNAQNSVMEQFKSLVESSKKREYKKMTFDWRASTFSDYVNGRAGEAGNCKVNLALFMQSIYYEDAETALANCYNKELEQNGVIVCVLRDEASFMKRLQSELSGKEYPTAGAMNNLTGKDIVAIAEKNGWKCEVHSPEYILDVSECLKEDSDKGGLMLDKLFNVKDTRKKASAAVREQIVKFLEKESTASGGSCILKEKLAIVIIYKWHENETDMSGEYFVGLGRAGD